MKKKICVITGGRADYGLLRWLMRDLRNDSEVNLQIIATGMHLSPEFGLTYVDIEYIHCSRCKPNKDVIKF